MTSTDDLALHYADRAEAEIARLAGELERSAAAARNCARNTDTASEMIRAALTTARDHGSDAAIRTLYEQAASVDHLLDGLDLPAAPPATAPKVAERIAAAIEAVDPVEWALAGQAAGQDAAAIARQIGADSA